MSAKITDLSRLMRLRKEQGLAPYVLFLGAGASVSSGYPLMRDLIRHVVGDLDNLSDAEIRRHFDEIWRRRSAIERYTLFHDAVKGGQASDGYHYLAALVSEGYFDIILTTNVDSLLEDTFPLWDMKATDFRVFIIHENYRHLNTRLDASQPRVKIVKLHGDVESYLLPFTLKETRELPREVESTLRRIMARDLVIVGHKMQDWDIQRCLPNEGESIWYVGPEGPGNEIMTAMDLRESLGNVIQGPEGMFDEFFRRLAEDLIKDRFGRLGTQYKDSFDQNDLNGIAVIHGSYGTEEGKFRLGDVDSHAVARIAVPFVKDVRIRLKVSIVNTRDDQNRDTHWVGFWARGRAPLFFDSNLIYLRRNGFVEIFSPKREILARSLQPVDTANPVQLTAEYRGKKLQVWVNDQPLPEPPEQEIVEREGHIYLYTYFSVAQLISLEVNSL